MPSATLSELLDALEAGAQLLLPNARAARELRWAFDARQRSRGLAAWEPPDVLSWTQWTSSQWSELVVAGKEMRLLLNAAQEHSLWREIIAADATSSAFGSTDSLAELAQSAWQRMARYEATAQLRSFAATATHDSRIFAEWAEAFTKQSATRGYLAPALLEHALRQHVRSGAMAAPNRLELVGFAEKTPAQESLLSALQERGVTLVQRSLRADAGESPLRASVIAPNEGEELRLAARWIRALLERRQAAGETSRVAILLPQVAEQNAELDEVLRETLAPELQSIEADLSSTPWEIAGGAPLSSLSMIADALTLARWAEGPLPLQSVSSLLLSPYLGVNGESGSDREARARFDAGVLRRNLQLRSEIALDWLVKLVVSKSPGETGLQAWLRSVQHAIRNEGDPNKPRSYGEWMEFVRRLTKTAGWPGERALTASEFEATRAWESALDTVATLDFSGRRVPFSTALRALELQTQKTAFAPPATHAPVQVMSLAEAEGSIFDAVVLLRATDENWPAPERVHPLLPWPMQRSLKMPGSDPTLAATKARTMMAGLVVRSGDVLVTSAAEDGNGKLRPSPLLGEMSIEPMEAASLVAPSQPETPIALECIADDTAIAALSSGEVKGGAEVLKLQAACGFLAFAKLRLRATEPEQDVLGLDAGETGNLVHRVLQRFWSDVQTQKKLRTMPWTERDALLMNAIEEALPKRLHSEDAWERSYVAVQKERLRAVLHPWLEEELRRGPFTVLESERDSQISIGPLTLDVRFDRIDSVGDGFFLVDYKTGGAGHPKEWDSERPDEPQLPLYALPYEPGELKGLAFAKVRTGKHMKWVGVQAEPGILPPSRTNKVIDLPLALEQWHATLTQLAEEFAAGKADVRPKSYAVNCARCGQRLLCRVDPAALLEWAGDEEEEAVDG